jgi:Glycosyl transferase family 90
LFCQYKYQINIDGTVAAYRLPYLLGGDSVVLKQDSKYYEFFYKQLRPYVHYIPVKADLSDLLQQIQWAKDHDQEVNLKAAANRLYKNQTDGTLLFSFNFRCCNVNGCGE